MWFTYILICTDNSLYTGITTNLDRRLREHNGKIRHGAKYTLAKRPVKLVYWEESESRSIAAKREAAIKKLTHDQKKQLARL